MAKKGSPTTVEATPEGVASPSSLPELVDVMMAPVDRSKLAGLVKAVGKKIGPDTITLYDVSNPWFKVPYWISTGAPDLDQKLGGGIAGGRVIEVFSRNESEGKSSVAATIARECQKMGGTVVWYDSERTVLPEYFRNFGLNVDDVVFFFNPTLESFFEAVEEFAIGFRDLFPAAPLLFVLDSVAASQTAAQEEADYEKSGVAGQARVMSASLRKIVPHLSKTQSTLLLVNQSRTKIGVMYGDDNETPGGRAMKFYASQRIVLRKVSKPLTDAEDRLIGIDVEAHIIKNKVAPPFKKSGFKLLFGKGISYAESAFDLLLRREKILGGAAGRYIFNGVVEGSFFKKDFPEILAAHPEVRKMVFEQVSIPEQTFTSEVDPELIDPDDVKTPE